MSAFVEVAHDQAVALIRQQFPQWAELPLTRVVPGGSDHVIYRLGDDLTARFPRHDGAVDQAHHEARWLPRLAKQLPLQIPQPVALGDPGQGYPWHWAVQRWLKGDAVVVEEYEDSPEAVETLARFIAALQGYSPDDAPPPTSLPLRPRDAATRRAIGAVHEEFDAAALTRVWEDGLAAPTWQGAPVWYHGDFHTGNLLATDHKITTVIDFGGLATGDPANDLMIAFTLFSDETRQIFRKSLAVDDATWRRARAWALTTGLTAYTAYAADNPRIRTATTRQILAAVAG